MGLDNGFCIKSTKRTLTRADLPDFIYPWSKDIYEDGAIEIAYARKYWGMRNSLVNGIQWDDEKDGFFFIMNPETVLSVIRIVSDWHNRDRWDEESMSIWSYEEAENNLLNWIINLSLAYVYMLRNPDVYLFFYDSY